jgi:hypothetical protein
VRKLIRRRLLCLIVTLCSLLEENFSLFKAENKMNEEAWPDYIIYCDDIVHKNLLHTVGISIAYLADNMDPLNNFPALFESRLELEIPNLIFIPSVDPNDENSFNRLLINLVDGESHSSGHSESRRGDASCLLSCISDPCRVECRHIND